MHKSSLIPNAGKHATGEPDAFNEARPVLRGADEEGLSSTSSAAYSTISPLDGFAGRYEDTARSLIMCLLFCTACAPDRHLCVNDTKALPKRMEYISPIQVSRMVSLYHYHC
jgi:hypothetical protein